MHWRGHNLRKKCTQFRFKFKTFSIFKDCFCFFFLERNTYLISVRVHLPTKSCVWFFLLYFNWMCMHFWWCSSSWTLIMHHSATALGFRIKEYPASNMSYSNRTHSRVEKVQVPNVELQLQNCIEEREREKNEHTHTHTNHPKDKRIERKSKSKSEKKWLRVLD